MNGLSEEELVKASFDYAVAQIIRAEEKNYPNSQFTTQFRQGLADFVYEYLTLIGADLEQFAKHGKRSVINKDDVLLLVRRNPVISQKLRESLQKP